MLIMNLQENINSMYILGNRRTFLHISLESHLPFAVQESPGAVTGCVRDTKHYTDAW